jgi:tRNA nucleotidyltransferase (CCA-adding enzyme)
MSIITNLAGIIEKQLPPEQVKFLLVAGDFAQSQGQRLYLVGGIVRDLLLKRNNFDLDLVVEGDAIELAQKLTEIKQAKITTHPRFGTAKLQWNKWSVDLATARSESYVKPGALPGVKPSSISSDLFRRDFTINAMAIQLNPDQHGKLIDPHEGIVDLKRKLIRVLHKKSFTDDATRIWRGIRYEQRLNFRLETDTLQLLKRGIPMLDTISGDRIRHEMECILQEERPEKILRRAAELNVLQKLEPALKGNGWLTEKFEWARQLTSPNLPPFGLYMAILAYRLTEEQSEYLISRLRLSKSAAQSLRDTMAIKTNLQALANPAVNPSDIYHILHGHSTLAITASSLACDSNVACQHIQLFLNRLRYVKPTLNGYDLVRMGIAPGPRIKEIIQLLHEARLDGKITNKQGEVGLVRRIKGGETPLNPITNNLTQHV